MVPTPTPVVPRVQGPLGEGSLNESRQGGDFSLHEFALRVWLACETGASLADMARRLQITGEARKRGGGWGEVGGGGRWGGVGLPVFPF